MFLKNFWQSVLKKRSADENEKKKKNEKKERQLQSVLHYTEMQKKKTIVKRLRYTQTQ